MKKESIVIKRGFTLIELIFAIVIIGLLTTMAVPKFTGLRDNAKISAEMQTAQSVQTMLDAINAQWVTSRCDFKWGVKELNSSITLNTSGYPNNLGANLENVIKNAKDWSCESSGSHGSKCKGPASKTNGVTTCKDGKPCVGKYWSYDAINGTFELN